MSNSLAIAAVTATLRNLLTNGFNADPDLSGTQVTTLPLDRAREGINTNQVNLFLYQTMINANWRNMDMPWQVKQGETGIPPLALDLFYLVTAYGADNNEISSHRLLGRTGSVLHDHTLLGSAEIKSALANNDLGDQPERVRITPQPLSLEEMSKLWTTFQTQYRISVAYQVSVVLIDSQLQKKTPLPVLTRGKDDRGIISQADLAPPFPTLMELLLPMKQPSARLGDVLTLTGFHLDGDSVLVRFLNKLFNAPVEIPTMAGGSDKQVTVQLPNTPALWPAGFYTAAVVVKRAGEPDRITNELPLTLAPRITTNLPMNVARVGSNATINLTCTPEVRPEQRAALLLSDREILANPHTAQTNSLAFVVTQAPLGTFLIRLRIDGVDSLVVQDYSAQPPVFDPNQKVTIT
jgi:hypothetical protein